MALSLIVTYCPFRVEQEDWEEFPTHISKENINYVIANSEW